MARDDGLLAPLLVMSIWTDFAGSSVSFVEVAGVRTRVVQLGPQGGRPLVLLHGRGGHLETFHCNVQELATHRRVIIFDLLGHGLSDHAGSSYDIGELRAHAVAVIEHIAGTDYDLIGQSLGGWIATLVALENAKVRQLVLIEPAGFQSEGERMSDPKVRAAVEKGGRAFDTPTEADVALRFAQLLLNKESIDPEMVALRTRLYVQPGAGAVHKAVRTADNAQWLVTSENMSTLSAQLLIVRGDHGHIPEALLSSVAASAGGQLTTIPQAKQWPHYENPVAANAVIGDFIKETTA